MSQREFSTSENKGVQTENVNKNKEAISDNPKEVQRQLADAQAGFDLAGRQESTILKKKREIAKDVFGMDTAISDDKVVSQGDLKSLESLQAEQKSYQRLVEIALDDAQTQLDFAKKTNASTAESLLKLVEINNDRLRWSEAESAKIAGWVEQKKQEAIGAQRTKAEGLANTAE